MARDEDLIAHGWPEDIWFHVDNLSSAHIYLRLPPTTTWDAIPTALLTDCAQLTKANSIEGNKKDNVTIIYTPWSNLKKSGNMATGQVGFKNDKMVKRVYVEKRENVIVNRLNKTKVEKFPDLREEKAEREKELRKVERIAAQEKVCLKEGGLAVWIVLTMRCRRRKRRRLPKSGNDSNGRRITCMMISMLMITWQSRATKTETRTSWTISCSDGYVSRATSAKQDRTPCIPLPYAFPTPCINSMATLLVPS